MPNPTHADLVALLERVLAHHIEAAGLSPEIVADKAAFTNFLNDIERRAEELKTDVSAALTALRSGAVVVVNPEELAAKIQAGVVDYINKFGKPIK